MNGDALFWDSCSNLGAAEGALDTALGHGRRSVLCSITVSTKGGEEEARMTVGDPIAAEQMEGGLRRGTSIFGALPTVDMDHHAGGIDIGDFEVETFMESQAAGIDGGKIGVILEGFDLGKNGSDFFNAKNGRKAWFIGLGGFRGCASFVGGRVRRRSEFRNSRCAWYWVTSDQRFFGEGNSPGVPAR